MNPFQELEYKITLGELSKMGLYAEKHGGDYIRGDLASIRIDIKTDLTLTKLKKKLQLFLNHNLYGDVRGGKKERYSGLKVYLFEYMFVLPK